MRFWVGMLVCFRILSLLLSLITELFGSFGLALRSRTALSAEVLFLRKQLAFYQERKVRPRRLTAGARLALVLWSSLFDWRDALIIVKPETLIGWHRKGFKLCWRLKSRAGRPPLPQEIRQLIARMVLENPTWGQERIAAELSLKLGIQVSPRTVRAYWPDDSYPGGTRASGQRWSTFVRNHAESLIACDFATVVTAHFRVLYVLVLMEVETRRMVHFNVTAHPTAEWTLQQFREAIPADHTHRFLIHDRDAVFSRELDTAIEQMGVKVLKTPVRAPKANAYCERLIGTMRRECLDFLIPLTERHLRSLLREWVGHYNHGRPHSSLGPGIPDPLGPLPLASESRHQLPARRVIAKSILSGLHHEYRFEEIAA